MSSYCYCCNWAVDHGSTHIWQSSEACQRTAQKWWSSSHIEASCSRLSWREQCLQSVQGLSWQAISIAMELSRPVLNFKVISIEEVKPANHLTLQLFESHQPTQRPMIWADNEMAAIKIIMKMIYSLHNRQQFTSGDTILPLSGVQNSTVICHDFLNIILYLRKDSPKIDTTGISV